MLVEIESLTGEEDAAAQRNRADRVQRQRQSGKALFYRRTADMEHRDEQRDEREASLRRQTVPVRGHEQEHTRAQRQRAEDERDPNGPPQPARARVFELISPNARRRFFIQYN